ncbi:MAG: FtsX-like permease family protein [Clostridia bacterium]|nr:FtsX-like permease family protein [Clostridia bacterium]
MSGGQMQRVAIARALVNNPDIILADEPTGALDTETSVQIMEILKKVAEDRLVIMVTHNPDLAEQYSTRIIRMVDGHIINDSNPLSDAEQAEAKKYDAAALAVAPKKVKKPSMSFATAFMLSLKNLFTKRGRTILTSFAGSIGIIGIALILAVSQGMTAYIGDVQENVLTTYPLTIQAHTVDMSELIESMMGSDEAPDHDLNNIYKDPIIGELVNALSRVEASKNDLRAFKAYLEEQIKTEGTALNGAVSGLQYTYDLEFPIYTENIDGEIIKSDTGELVADMLVEFFAQLAESDSPLSQMGPAGGASGGSVSAEMMSTMLGLEMWQELLPGLNDEPVNPVLYEQYDLLRGKWPEKANEIVLVLDRNNELDDLTLYALGLISRAEIDAIIKAAANQEELDSSSKSWSYDEIIGMTFKTIMPYDCYQESGGVWKNVLEYDAPTSIANPVELLYKDAYELTVVGVIRPAETADATMITGSIGYTNALTKHVIEGAKDSLVVQAQLANPSVDVLTGRPFESNTGTMSDEEKKAAFASYVLDLNVRDRAEAYFKVKSLDMQNAKAADVLDATAVAGVMVNFMVQDADGNGDGGKGELIGMLMLSMPPEQITPEVNTYLNSLDLEALKGMLIASPAIHQMAVEQVAQFGDKTTLDAITDIIIGMFIRDTDGNGDGGKGELIDIISAAIAGETDISTDTILSYLEKMDLEKLKELIRPTVMDQAKLTVNELTEAGLVAAGLTDDASRSDKLLEEVETYSAEQSALYYNEVTVFSENTYDATMAAIGCVDLDDPKTVNIYASSFENRDAILKAIDDYNEGVPEEKKISNTDYLGIIMSSITIIINAITYVLIAFVAISLVVSSIMIGVITLISVQERTKEIGILRAIGASKRNVSSMFNAETIIVGFAAGLLGVAVTYLLCIPINAILFHFTGIANLRAFLPVGAALILIAISVFLTLLAGFIPSRSAAKKDPVVALRTE